MVEISNKYKLGVRRFGLINWVGFWTLYKKEVLRFSRIWKQTIIPPVITNILYYIINISISIIITYYPIIMIIWLL